MSKLFYGESPSTDSSFEFWLNFAFSANNSSPRSVKTKMKRKRNTEKEVMSLRVLPNVSSKSSNLFHYLASLKILRSLNPLKAVMTEPLLSFCIA